MPNDQLQHPRDSLRIDLSRDHDVRHWSAELGVTEDELRAAVQSAGNRVENVRQRLRTVQDGR